MIKLSKIYCNHHDVFPDIEFHDGLNIVYASVSKASKVKTNHSHSVGKTTLLEVIDYALVKTIDKHHFLKKHKKIFASYVFYLELQVSEKLYATVKREVTGKISITTSKEKMDYRVSADNVWEYPNLGLEKAKQRLSAIADLNVLPMLHTDCRKGLRYCFRRQSEFRTTFKVKAVSEKAISWKPYLGGLLGINVELIEKKLLLNDKVQKYKDLISEIKEISGASTQAIEAEIQVVSVQVDEKRRSLDSFDFQKSDQNTLKLLVNELDVEISKYNKEIYILELKLKTTIEALQAKFNFDLDQVKELFNEVSLHIPEQLVKTYEELVVLNTSLTIGRNSRLKVTKTKLEQQRNEVQNKLIVLNKQRAEQARQLLDEDAFKRYKYLQAEVSLEEAKLVGF